MLYSSFHRKNAPMLGLLGGKLTPSPLEGSGPFRAQYAEADLKRLAGASGGFGCLHSS